MSVWKSDRPALVTGATGLLGPWLVDALVCQNIPVIALVRECDPRSLFATQELDQRVTVVRGEMTDFTLLLRILNEFDIETIFHLGAQAIVGIANRSPLSTFTSNIQGTWNLLEAARLSPWVKRIIVASSDKAYGNQEILPYTEETPLAGRHPYDVSKSCADLIAQTYITTYNLPICITRCGNFFGGGDMHKNRIVPGTIWSALQNERPIIRSNGKLIRDYIYVRDVVDGYLTIAAQMDRSDVVGQAFNLSTDIPFSVIEIVHKILVAMERTDLEPIIRNQASNEIPAQHLSSTKAQKILGWKARWGIEKGLHETIAWYRAFAQQSLSKNSVMMPFWTNQEGSTNAAY